MHICKGTKTWVRNLKTTRFARQNNIFCVFTCIVKPQPVSLYIKNIGRYNTLTSIFSHLFCNICILKEELYWI
jgi:hypothetical protein